jgi:hypothetical protein
LYAGGDPINGIDPSGRITTEDYALALKFLSVAQTVALRFFAKKAIVKILCTAAGVLIKLKVHGDAGTAAGGIFAVLCAIAWGA